MEFENAELSRARICLIGNSKLSKMVHSLIPEFQAAADISIIDNIFSDALLSARHLVEQGNVDIFVSAGANAYYLKNTLPVPVVALKIRQSDLISAVLKARAISHKILILLHEDQAVEWELLSHLPGVEIVQKSYVTADDANNIFHSLRQQGFGAVVGSSYICDLAEQAGIPYVMIYSRASCRLLLRRAINLAGEYKRERQQQAFADFLLANTGTATLVTNREERVIAFNDQARELLANLYRGRRIDKLLDKRFLDTDDTVAEGILLNDRLCRVGKRAFDVGEERVGHVYSIKAAPVSRVEEGRDPVELVFRSRRMHEATRLLSVYGATPGSVLLRGETGSGKELAAREVHRASVNRDGPFVAINCAAIPSELFEAELFGYADGAFTHARSGGKSGLLEAANNGTFFMDEINSLPMPQQAKLLRVLQDREVRPVGSRKSVALNVKFVAACNHDLMEEVRGGRFREDLYYRLNVFTVQLPSLRERPEDIEPLTRYFIRRLSARYQMDIEEDALCEALLPVFLHYGWPGNVRQLENLLERLMVSSSMYDNLNEFAAAIPHLAPELFDGGPGGGTDQGHLRQKEQEEILRVLEQFNGNRSQAAEYLGISQTTLWRRLKELEKRKQQGG
ncbi:sigma 54-interacting transcriptional regulator [Alloalcanivorax sp. C16-1]|uniref:sigma 54-interacting transcriptional regulator n=1 Tax=Alloalcanivorax sp. C16-1 TaxID=3390051 RepID=UPI003970E316